MSHEIERKFLVNVDLDYLLQATNTNSDLYDGLHGEYWIHHTITQHYLKNTGDWAIRVRRIEDVTDHGDGWETTYEYVQTMKYRIDDRKSVEIEEKIDEDSFNFLASDRSLTTPALIKRRHRITYGNDRNLCWEVDEFLNPEYAGLVLAEIELKKPDQFFRIPFWMGKEVTHLKKYRNARMARKLEKDG